MAGKPYEPLVDVARASEMIGVSLQKVRDLVRSRKLHATTFSGHGDALIYRFRPSDIDRAIRRIHNAKGFSAPYADAKWQVPPQAAPAVAFRAGRPRVAFDLDRARELRDAGMGYAKIALEVGVSSTTVANALRNGRTEIHTSPGRPGAAIDLDKALALRREGKTYAEIAAELGVSQAIISRAVRQSAPELMRPPGFRDNEAIVGMLAMLRDGASFTKIGEAFNLTSAQIAHGFRALGIINPRGNRDRFHFDIPRAMEMRRAGKTYREIGKEFGLSAAIISHSIHESSGLKRSHLAFDVKLALKMRRQGRGYAEIAKAVGVSGPTVANALKAKMLSQPARYRQSRFDLDRAKAMWHEGQSLQEIAAAFGLGLPTVAVYLKRSGIAVRPRRGGPQFDLELARRLQIEGLPYREIAIRCGVSPHTIARYLKRLPKQPKNAKRAPQPAAAEPSDPVQ